MTDPQQGNVDHLSGSSWHGPQRLEARSGWLSGPGPSLQHVSSQGRQTLQQPAPRSNEVVVTRRVLAAALLTLAAAQVSARGRLSLVSLGSTQSGLVLVCHTEAPTLGRHSPTAPARPPGWERNPASTDVLTLRAVRSPKYTCAPFDMVGVRNPMCLHGAPITWSLVMESRVKMYSACQAAPYHHGRDFLEAHK